MSELDGFSHYPMADTDHAVVPEYFRPVTIETLLPGQVIFPLAEAVAIDRSNGDLYLDSRNYLIGEDDFNPASLKGRIAAMAIIGPVSGYIADLRHMHPNDIFTNKVSSDVLQKGWTYLEAALVTDLDGKEQSIGKKDCSQDLAYLKLQTEDQRQKMAAAAMYSKLQQQVMAARAALDYQPRHARD